MRAPRNRARLATGCAAAALALCAPSARAGDFMDTTITFVAGDDNVFAGAGETSPSSPRMDFRPRTGNNLFFENYNTRNTGEETRGELVLYKEFTGYFTRVVPEAAMVLQWDANRIARDSEQFQATANRKTIGGLRDDGSYLAIHFDGTDVADPADPKSKPSRLSLVLFPADSDRLRLGYSWELTWGGRGSFLLANYVPGLMLGYKAHDWYAFAGAKTARTQRFTESDTDPHKDESEAIYGVLGGGGAHVTPNLLLEAGAGFFDKGTIPTERAGIEGTWLHQMGVSGQVTWHDGIDPKVPVDTKLLRNVGGDLKPRDWRPKHFGYLISAEATWTSQNLEATEGDVRQGNPRREHGFAGDLNAALQTGRWTFSVDLVARNLAFIVQDTPGAYPYGTLSDAVETSPEIFGAVGADYTFPDLRFVPGIALGLQQPAYYRTDDRSIFQGSITYFRKTKNVLGETQVFPGSLPPGEDVAPILAGKAYLREYLSDLVSIVLQGQLTYDNNQLVNDPDSGARKFDQPLILGLNVLAQAKF